MKKILMTLLIKIMIAIFLKANSQNFQLTKESFSYPENIGVNESFVGYYNASPAFISYKRKPDSIQVELKYYNESIGKLQALDTRMTINKRTYSSYVFHNSKLFFRKLIFNDIDDSGYSNLYLFAKSKSIKLDSIYNSDKHIHSSFSSDGRYLLVNTLNTLSDYYNPEQDDRIIVYDLQGLDKGEIKKESIVCKYCSNSYLVDSTLYFMKANERDAYGGFDNTEIYSAPWGKIDDTTRIASTSKIISITPDGKYILATRFFDLQKSTCVIIDVEKKKYQLLLGRDYPGADAFYSHKEQKFAFNFKGKIVYVDFPKNYPFDALKWRNEEIPDATKKEFWKQFEHPPFAE